MDKAITDLSKKTLFTSSQVLQAVNITYRQLSYWQLKGLIKPTYQRLGTRDFKRYTQQDIDTLKTVKRLLDEGYSLPATDTLKEIARRKEAEEALREAKVFSDSLIASMQDGFSVLDNHGVHINVNPAFCRMTGFEREELIGVGPPHPYWPPEQYKEIEKAFQNTLRGEFADFELTFMRKNGERFPAIVSPSWIKDKQGNVISYFATVKDITERKKVKGIEN